MGDINPKKMPKARTVMKRDGDEPVKLYRKGGEVWDKPNPAKKSKSLSPEKKRRAKAAAAAAGRPYPNLIDNMRAARSK